MKKILFALLFSLTSLIGHASNHDEFHTSKPIVKEKIPLGIPIIREGYNDQKCIRFSSMAPPMFWGPFQRVVSHIGPVSFYITARPVGSTQLHGRVRYWATESRQVVKQFMDSIRIRTANVAANIEVSFKGIPTGTAVIGTINCSKENRNDE